MTEPVIDDEITVLARHLEGALFKAHGPMIFGEVLRTALGYLSVDAFRQSVRRRTVPVPVFSIPNRRGKYALVKDVAYWLAEQRCRNQLTEK